MFGKHLRCAPRMHGTCPDDSQAVWSHCSHCCCYSTYWHPWETHESALSNSMPFNRHSEIWSFFLIHPVLKASEYQWQRRLLVIDIWQVNKYNRVPKKKINSENAMHAELIDSSIDTLLAYRIIIKKTKTKKHHGSSWTTSILKPTGEVTVTMTIFLCTVCNTVSLMEMMPGSSGARALYCIHLTQSNPYPEYMEM